MAVLNPNNNKWIHIIVYSSSFGDCSGFVRRHDDSVCFLIQL